MEVTLTSRGREDIVFGTDGWRGIIADTFTFENVAFVTKAYSKYLKKQGAVKGVAVGYDTRFLSREFAETVCAVLADNGIQALLSDAPLPTPALSYAVANGGLTGGLMLTASHNPPSFNGFKVKGAYGGSATPSIIDKIEKEVKNLNAGDYRSTTPLEEHLSAGRIQRVDFAGPYIDRIGQLVGLQGGAPGPIAVDPMYGAGIGYMTRLLRDAGYAVEEVRSTYNPGFDGVAPEPIERNLEPLRGAIADRKCQMGLATDGDADRIGAMDHQGRFVDSHRIFALLLRHLVVNRGLRGKVVKAFSSTQMIDRLCQKYDLPLEIVPVGFKHVTQRMLDEDVLLGGEESGGFGMRGHLPERDGVLNGLLLVKMCEEGRCSLAQLVDELLADVGPHWFDRSDLTLSEAEKASTRVRLRDTPPTSLGGQVVERVEETDGHKFFFAHEEWAMIRQSGTEPVVRLYAEAQTPQRVQAYISSMEQWIHQES